MIQVDFDKFSQKEVLLDNVNVLLHQWSPENNQELLGIDENCRFLIQKNADEAEITDDQIFLQKVFVLLHYQSFVKYIHDRTEALNLTADTLKEHYRMANRIQALRLYAYNISYDLNMKLRVLMLQNQGCKSIDNERKESIDKKIESVIQIFQKLMIQLSKTHESHMLNNVNEQLQISGFSLGARPSYQTKKFVISNQSDYRIFATVKANFTYGIRASTPLFSQITKYSFAANHNEASPVFLELSLQWSQAKLPDLRDDLVGCGEHSAKELFKKRLIEDKVGVIEYQVPQLVAKTIGFFSDRAWTQYRQAAFQLMVEIAQKHHCREIVLYARYDFAPIAYSLGFYPNSPLLSYEKEVQRAFSTKSHVKLLSEDLNRFEDDVEVLTPYRLPLGCIGSREVYFTSQGLKTTYAKLIAEKPLIDPNLTKDDVFLDFSGMANRPFVSLFKLIQDRELGKKINTVCLGFAEEMTDARVLDDDIALAEIGETSEFQPKDFHKTLRTYRN